MGSYMLLDESSLWLSLPGLWSLWLATWGFPFSIHFPYLLAKQAVYVGKVGDLSLYHCTMPFFVCEVIGISKTEEPLLAVSTVRKKVRDIARQCSIKRMGRERLWMWLLATAILQIEALKERRIFFSPPNTHLGHAIHLHLRIGMVQFEFKVDMFSC